MIVHRKFLSSFFFFFWNPDQKSKKELGVMWYLSKTPHLKSSRIWCGFFKDSLELWQFILDLIFNKHQLVFYAIDWKLKTIRKVGKHHVWPVGQNIYDMTDPTSGRLSGLRTAFIKLLRENHLNESFIPLSNKETKGCLLSRTHPRQKVHLIIKCCFSFPPAFSSLLLWVFIEVVMKGVTKGQKHLWGHLNIFPLSC